MSEDKSAKGPRMRLDLLWQEVGQPVKEEPCAEVASVLRMDGEALVIDTKAQTGVFMGFGVFVMLFVNIPLVAYATVELWRMLAHRLTELDAFDVWIWGLIALAVPVMLAFSFWFLYLGLIRPAPSPIIFNRRTRKVCGSHHGRPLELHWDRVRPVLTKGKMYLNGAQTFYNLVLFQPDTAHDWFNSRIKRGHGLIVTAGHAWGWGTCHQLFEFIRRYMDEEPKQAAKRLPAVEIAPAGEGWVGKVLDEGPYYDLTEGGNRMQRLRERNGKPELYASRSLYVAFMGPASLISVLMAFFRRKVQLPPQSWPQATREPCPYSVLPPRPEDMALRRRAAPLVALWLLLTVGSGCAFWGWLAWLIVHSG